MDARRLARPSTLAAIALAAGHALAIASPVDRQARSDRLEDFDTFCRFVADDYAYFDVKKTDWQAACEASRPAAAAASTRAAFIGVVERVLGELYDAHAHLGTSTPASPRLVPTDSDLFAKWHADAAVIVDVRSRSSAWTAGVRPGMRVVEIDGRAVNDTVDAIAPKHLTAPDAAARDWALQVALAGHQDRKPVRVVAEVDGIRRTYAFVPDRIHSTSLLSTRRDGRVGIIAIHNALGDPRLIAAFDDALDVLGDVDALVLDLRDTPSGGNTTVARGIMGRLVTHEAAYQRHERVAEMRESGIRHVWVEYVEPRGRTFDGPVVVLVGRWTGSMSEGIAIGLNAARGALVFGSPMAGLLGALDERKLPHAGFVVRIPGERLSHIDGTPREAFVPCPTGGGDLDDDGEVVRLARIAASMVGSSAATACPDDP